jgi:hypothetical protein
MSRLWTALVLVWLGASNAAGGGAVYFPPGVYLSGSILEFCRNVLIRSTISRSTLSGIDVDSCRHARISNIAPSIHRSTTRTFKLSAVQDFSLYHCGLLPDARLAKASQKEF